MYAYPIILGSGSPRRKELMNALGIPFTVCPPDVDETYPSGLQPYNIPEYLAAKKAKHLLSKFPDHLILCADTLVVLNGEVLSKPASLPEAKSMLKKLSNNAHEVVTAFCLALNGDIRSVSDSTTVYFGHVTDQQIEYYLQHFPPLDKAGAYGVQDWMGYIGIESITGSFYTVMGLPIHLVYKELEKYKV